MKIIINIPDWVSSDMTLTLLSGQELVAFKHPGKEWKVKTDRCNQCGECCLDIPEGYLPFGTNGEGRCNKLDSDYKCTAGNLKPFCCLPDPPNIEELGCSISYKE